MRADRGVPMAAMSVAMIAVFVIALTLNEVWTAGPGGLAPGVFVVAYAVIRAVHLGVYRVAAGDAPDVRAPQDAARS